MNEDKAQEALAEISMLSGRLIQRPGSSEEDAIVVAAALMRSAEMIFRHFGGPKYAAAQFQNVADRLSAETH
jgi:hypothetical protein